MDTAALTAYLEAEWPEVIAEASIDPARIVSIVAEVYAADATLSEAWAERLADYYLLRRAVRAFAVDFDVSTQGDSYRLSQRKQIAALLDQAAADVAWIIAPDDDGTGALVTVTQDFIFDSGEAS